MSRAHCAMVATLGAAAMAGCGGGSGGGATTTAAAPGAGAQRTTIERYFAAVAAGRPRAACAELTKASRERLAEFAKPLRATGEGCPAAMAVVLRSRYGARLARLAHPVIDRLDSQGTHATAFVDGVDSRVVLARESEGWRIDFTPSVEADKLPGGPRDNGGEKKDPGRD